MNIVDNKLPDGWKLVKKATCYVLQDGNAVVASLAGPDAEGNAEILARLLTPTPSMRQALESADVQCLLSFIFTRFGSPVDARELTDEVIASVRRLEAALGAPSEQPQKEADAAPMLPDGWKLVPIKPTRDMINDGIFTLQEWDARTGEDYGMEDMWVAMLAAAPKPIPGRTADIELPPLPELCGANPWRMSVEQAREYARAAVLHDRQKQPQKRCQYCDDTGDVHSIDGEWRGVCTECNAAPQQPAQGQDAKDGEMLDWLIDHEARVKQSNGAYTVDGAPGRHASGREAVIAAMTAAQGDEPEKVKCPGCGERGEPNGKDGKYRCGSGYQGGCTR